MKTTGKRPKTPAPVFDAEGYQTNLTDLNRTPLPDLPKPAKAMAILKRRRPAKGARYSTIVENPFEAGYWPPLPATRADLAAARRRRQPGITSASR